MNKEEVLLQIAVYNKVIKGLESQKDIVKQSYELSVIENSKYKIDDKFMLPNGVIGIVTKISVSKDDVDKVLYYVFFSELDDVYSNWQTEDKLDNLQKL